MAEQTMNGVAETLPQATELILSNGLKVWVYPISARDRMELIRAWMKDNPEPDRKTYELPVPAEDASFEGQTLAAEGNPAYRRMVLEWRNAMNESLTSALLVGYTEFPDVSEQELITRFARVIKRKRRVMQLPEDEWEATLTFALLETPDDQRLIISAIEKRLPVEWEGVIDQVAIFRPLSKQHPPSGLSNGQSEAQGTKQEA